MRKRNRKEVICFQLTLKFLQGGEEIRLKMYRYAIIKLKYFPLHEGRKKYRKSKHGDDFSFFASSWCKKLLTGMYEAYIFQVKYSGMKYLKTPSRFNGKTSEPGLGRIL